MVLAVHKLPYPAIIPIYSGTVVAHGQTDGGYDGFQQRDCFKLQTGRVKKEIRETSSTIICFMKTIHRLNTQE
jgi:hypothetical protein